jgi:hypothetical protein
MRKEKKPSNPNEEANSESRNAEDIELAIQTLAHVLQRHLLMFAFVTYGYRFNPEARNNSPLGEPVEYILAPNLSDFDDDDDDGEFLLESLNQRLLIKHIEKAYSEFGRGKGKRPTTQAVHYTEEKSRVSVTHKNIEGGTLPAWRLSYKTAHYYLERSTGAIIETVCRLRKVDTLNRFSEIADLAEEVARPADHPTWGFPSTLRPEENIPWNYPQQVLEATSRVKDAKSQIFKHYREGAKVEKEIQSQDEHKFSHSLDCDDVCLTVDVIEKHGGAERKKKSIVRKVLEIIAVVVAFFAALLTCLYYLRWLEPIKVFIYKLFAHK